MFAQDCHILQFFRPPAYPLKVLLGNIRYMRLKGSHVDNEVKSPRQWRLNGKVLRLHKLSLDPSHELPPYPAAPSF